MKELIIIKKNKNGGQVVSAKELYDGLGLNRSEWSRWYKRNIEQNDFFTENTDWVRFVITPNRGGKTEMDFAISLEFAKHITMMARTEKSHLYRQYLIECEKEFKEVYLNYEEIITQTYGKLYTINDALDLLNNMRTVGNNLDAEGLFSFLIKDKVLTNKNSVTRSAINNRKAIEVNNEIYLAEKTLKKFIKNSTDGEFFNLKQVNPGKTFKEVVDSIKDLKYFEEIEE